MSALNFFLTNSNISVMLVLELFLLVGDGWIPVLHWVSISTSLTGCGAGGLRVTHYYCTYGFMHPPEL